VGVTGVEVDTDLVAALRTSRDGLVARWCELAAVPSVGRSTPAELRRDLGEVFDSVAQGLAEAGTDLAAPAFDELRALLAELSTTRVRQGYSPRETAMVIFSLKEALLPHLRDLGQSEHFIDLSRFIDEMGLFTFESYVRARETVIVEQTTQLLELSTPVVKLWDGILAVPLVGTLDSARTQVVMEKLLQALVETESTFAIIDITGVPAVDTQVAQHLLKTVMAARLMGAECIISGIRPQIAQTVVGLGIEFGEIATKASLADALVLALRRSGSAVVRQRRSPEG